MYNHNLDTFLHVAETGSFTSAAEQLHMTPSGVKKQIDALEDFFGVALFVRETKGVKLTENGQVLFIESHRLIDVSDDIFRKTKCPKGPKNAPVRIGAALLNPTEEFNRICKATAEIRRIPIRIISYASDINTAVPTSVQNADSAEIGFGAEPSVEYFAETDFLPFTKYKLTCAFPAEHPLVQKRNLTLSDLEGETLLFPSRGNPKLTFDFSRELGKTHPDIKVETPSLFYDLELFNRCATEKKALISLECWDNIHPGLVNLPVDWDWEMPYGLIWKKDARKEVLDFITAFRNALKQQAKGKN